MTHKASRLAAVELNSKLSVHWTDTTHWTQILSLNLIFWIDLTVLYLCNKRSPISCLAQNILTFVLLLYFRDVKHMLLKLVELRSSNWGRVHGTTPHTEATPENDPNYFMVRIYGHFSSLLSCEFSLIHRQSHYSKLPTSVSLNTYNFLYDFIFRMNQHFTLLMVFLSLQQTQVWHKFSLPVFSIFFKKF